MSWETTIFALIGFVLLTYGAELLVRGASRIASFFHIPPVVIGLTVVAFATGSPELAVSIHSAMINQPDITVGNIVGSNILNTLLVMGLASLITPLVIHRKITKRDVPIMILASVATLVFSWTGGTISRLESAFLCLGMIGFTGYISWQALQESAANRKAHRESGQTTPPHSGWIMLKNAAYVIIGLAGLVYGARWMVDGAILVARHFGVSELLIGLTIVAIGTSLPELAATIAAGLKGERDIAVGNIVGSNIFNILAVLGVTGMISPSGLPVPKLALDIDMPVMLISSLACIPLFMHAEFRKKEGLAFLGCYVIYTAILILRQSNPGAVPSWYIWAGFGLPVLALVIQKIGRRTPKRDRL